MKVIAVGLLGLACKTGQQEMATGMGSSASVPSLPPSPSSGKEMERPWLATDHGRLGFLSLS